MIEDKVDYYLYSCLIYCSFLYLHCSLTYAFESRNFQLFNSSEKYNIIFLYLYKRFFLIEDILFIQDMNQIKIICKINLISLNMH